MTKRPTALVGAAIISIAVLTGTQVNARPKQKNNYQTNSDQHFVGGSSYSPQVHERRRHARPRSVARVRAVSSSFTNRDCLDAPTRALLNNLEARFGRVALVKVCVPGARMPSGHVSWHARNKAFDFRVPKGVDHRDVMVWLTKHSPGVTISYRGALAGIIHTDTGSFRKVIYAAANHEAGERAVAIWQRRARDAVQLAALSRPDERERKPQREPAPWTMTAAYVEPDFEEYAVQPEPVRPAPITWGDRRGIFQRYFESKDVVVAAHTSLTCPNGNPFPPKLAQLPKDAAAHFGRTAYINSGYRTPERNRRVGGARNSQHMKCRAIDWRVAGVSIADLRRWVVSRLGKYDVRWHRTYKTHIHTDARQSTPTRRVYAKHRKPSRYAAAG